MDMGGGGMGSMPMGGMDMGDGVPGLFYLQRMYWAVAGSAIAAFTVANIFNKLIAWQRSRDGSPRPARPKSIFLVGYATLTAMAREVSYASLRPVSIWRWKWHLPPLGLVLLALANLVVLMVFCFYKLNTADQWSWENVGYRTGFITIAQLPMIILLAGKNNWIGYVTGSSYERLNWLHRWFARTLWLTATIHMCFWFRDWGRYNYIVAQLKENYYAQTGFSSWIVLTFILLTSSKPIRAFGYEIFLPLHLCTWAGFIAAVYYHAPDEVKAWVWVPIGLFCFDRVSRIVIMLFANTCLFGKQKQGAQEEPSRLGNYATFTPLPGNVTKISFPSPSISWRPGQHVFLGCHGLAPFQSHPFSIASLPSDGKMEFLVRAQGGATKRFFRYATKQHSLLGNPNDASSVAKKLVTVEGPYGNMRCLRQFDSVVLIAGGIGATYTVPLLRDIVQGWKEIASASASSGLFARRTNTRKVRFVWAIKSRSQLLWFEEQLRKAMQDVEDCRSQNTAMDVELDISVYLTCDEEFYGSPEVEPDTRPQVKEKYLSATSTLGGGSENYVAKYDEDIKPATVSKPVGSSSDEDVTSAKSPAEGGACMINKSCQCKHTVVNEETDEIKPCCCSGAPPGGQATQSPRIGDDQARRDDGGQLPSYTEKPATYQDMPSERSMPPQLRIFTGRPHLKNLLSASLERAGGESGVVVCGPPGLEADTRCSVVSLSDERAVHKGTGAQGIYFHSEGFWF